ncbi:hypothetical protein C1701_01420 [Actinoalloteichus sp. AHMU CJ021]|nr:hypothetical protein C1701_01420 [Actinoalloteichus sp. AHMU CJ021]
MWETVRLVDVIDFPGGGGGGGGGRPGVPVGAVGVGWVVVPVPARPEPVRGPLAARRGCPLEELWGGGAGVYLAGLSAGGWRGRAPPSGTGRAGPGRGGVGDAPAWVRSGPAARRRLGRGGERVGGPVRRAPTRGGPPPSGRGTRWAVPGGLGMVGLGGFTGGSAVVGGGPPAGGGRGAGWGQGQRWVVRWWA